MCMLMCELIAAAATPLNPFHLLCVCPSSLPPPPKPPVTHAHTHTHPSLDTHRPGCSSIRTLAQPEQPLSSRRGHSRSGSSGGYRGSNGAPGRPPWCPQQGQLHCCCHWCHDSSGSVGGQDCWQAADVLWGEGVTQSVHLHEAEAAVCSDGANLADTHTHKHTPSHSLGSI